MGLSNKKEQPVALTVLCCLLSRPLGERPLDEGEAICRREILRGLLISALRSLVTALGCLLVSALRSLLITALGCLLISTLRCLLVTALGLSTLRSLSALRRLLAVILFGLCELYIFNDDLGSVDLLTILVCVRVVLELTLDHDLGTFLEVLSYKFSLLAE